MRRSITGLPISATATQNRLRSTKLQRTALDADAAACVASIGDSTDDTIAARLSAALHGKEESARQSDQARAASGTLMNDVSLTNDLPRFEPADPLGAQAEAPAEPLPRLAQSDSGAAPVGAGAPSGVPTWSVAALIGGATVIAVAASQSTSSEVPSPVPAPVPAPAPAATRPTALELMPANDTGVDGDLITSDLTPVLRGSGRAGERIVVRNGTTEVGTTTVSADGSWTVELTPLTEGTRNLLVVALNADGRESDPAAVTLILDATSPTVSAVTTTLADGIYSIGQAIPLSVLLSEPVAAGSTLVVNFDNGQSVSVSAPTTGTALTGTYTVTQASEATADLAVTSLTVGATAIADAAGNALAMALPANVIGSTTAIQINAAGDTVAPLITQIRTTANDGVYGPGKSIALSVTMSETVAAGSSLVLTLDNGQIVTVSTGSAATTLSGAYTVGGTDSKQDSADLTVTSIAQGGTVTQDLAGNAAQLAVPSDSLGGQTAIIVDTTAPTFAAASLAIDQWSDMGPFQLNAGVLNASDTVTSTANLAVTGATLITYPLSKGVNAIEAKEVEVLLSSGQVTIQPSGAYQDMELVPPWNRYQINPGKFSVATTVADAAGNASTFTADFKIGSAENIIEEQFTTTPRDIGVSDLYVYTIGDRSRPIYLIDLPDPALGYFSFNGAKLSDANLTPTSIPGYLTLPAYTINSADLTDGASKLTYTALAGTAGFANAPGATFTYVGYDTGGGVHDQLTRIDLTFYGSSGDDPVGVLTGGPNGDRITGGGGNDTMTGGAGNDLFGFSNNAGEGADSVTDFRHDGVRNDRIYLSDVTDRNANRLFDAADVDILVTVAGADAIVTIRDAVGATTNSATVIALSGAAADFLNAGGAVKPLQQLIDENFFLTTVRAI